MKSALALFILLAAAWASANYYPNPNYQVFGEPHTETDKKDIDQLIEKFRQAWAQQDAKGVAALHATDVEWINAFGRTFRGSEQLEEFLAQRLFPEFESEVWQRAMSSYKPISRRYIGSHAAVINAQTQSGPGSAVGPGGRRVSFTFVLQKNAGRWEIAHQAIADIRERRND